jgi:tRNA(Ser,Leu) C12 N-acetylase TAN1
MNKNLALILGIIIGLILTGFILTSLHIQEQLKEVRKTQVEILKSQIDIRNEIIMLKVKDQTFAIPIIATRLTNIEDRINLLIDSQSKKPQDLKIEVYQNGQVARTFNSVDEALKFLKAYQEYK